MRDWTRTLSPASFKGVPFWVRHDDMATGRRLNVSEIPNSDDPFFEDLGAKRRPVQISGYFIGDVSDAQMIALETVCGQKGAGPLSLPAQGLVTARCEDIKRRRDRDEMGKFAFEATFILDPRSGFANPTAALPAEYLAQRAFDASDGLAAALPGLISGLRA